MFTFPTISVKQPPLPQSSAAVPETSTISDRIEVFVLTHGKKPSLTVQTLQSLGVPFTPYVNQDWDWPPDHPELQTPRNARPSVRGYALRAYRIFRGHQEIMARAAADKFTLIFEDDATLAADVTADIVIDHINAAPHFLTAMKYDAVSFHAREQSPPTRTITLYGREYAELGLIQQRGWGHVFFLQPVAASYGGRYKSNLYRWHEGCLAYMVGPAARAKWLAARHGNGMPCDLFLVNELNTIVMRRSLFSHDCRHGSLLANHGNVASRLKDDGTPTE